MGRSPPTAQPCSQTATIAAMSERNDHSRKDQNASSSGAWRHILMWTVFGLTLVVTIIIVLQAMLLTTGFA